MSSLGQIFLELKKRHLFQIAIGYMAAGWIFIEMTGFLVDNYDLSRKLIDISVLLAALCFPAVLIIGWFHGERGHQRVQRAEAWLLVTLMVIAGIGTYRISVAEEVGGPNGSDFAFVAPNDPDDTRLIESTEDLGARSLAVFPFENNVADEELAWLGSGLADMLTTNFAQVPRLRVVGRQRLLDLLNQASVSETDEIPDNLATDLAVRSGAHLMVRGTVIGSADDIVIDAQMIELETGTVVAAERVRGDDVFALVDSLSARFGRQLFRGRPLELAESARPPAAIGTRNLEAYRAFHEGLVAEREGRADDAMRGMVRAVTLDSTFGLAALRLSAHDLDSPEAEKYMEIAFEALEKIPAELLAEKGIDLSVDSMQILIQVDSLVSEALADHAGRATIQGERRPPRDPGRRRPPPDGPDGR